MGVDAAEEREERQEEGERDESHDSGEAREQEWFKEGQGRRQGDAVGQ